MRPGHPPSIWRLRRRMSFGDPTTVRWVFAPRHSGSTTRRARPGAEAVAQPLPVARCLRASGTDPSGVVHLSPAAARYPPPSRTPRVAAPPTRPQSRTSPAAGGRNGWLVGSLSLSGSVSLLGFDTLLLVAHSPRVGGVRPNPLASCSVLLFPPGVAELCVLPPAAVPSPARTTVSPCAPQRDRAPLRSERVATRSSSSCPLPA